MHKKHFLQKINEVDRTNLFLFKLVRSKLIEAFFPLGSGETFFAAVETLKNFFQGDSFLKDAQEIKQKSKKEREKTNETSKC